MPAADTLTVVVGEAPPSRLSIGRMVVGLLGRRDARREVQVIDRRTRRPVVRIPVDGPEAEARALADILAGDLARMDERAFLKRHGRAHRHR